MTATWPPDTGDATFPPPPDPVPPPGRVRRTLAKVPPWVAPVAVGGLALSSCVYVALVDPNQPGNGFYPQCTFKQLTGLDCPGCGLTRAMHALMTGDPLRAINHNIVILAIFPIAVYVYTRWLLMSTLGYELPRLRMPNKVRWALLPVILAFWVLRNLPWAPFVWLNSTA